MGPKGMLKGRKLPFGRNTIGSTHASYSTKEEIRVILTIPPFDSPCNSCHGSFSVRVETSLQLYVLPFAMPPERGERA